MRVREVLESLQHYATSQQRPKLALEAHRQLSSYSGADITIALNEALSGDEDLVLFTLGLIADVYLHLTEVLPRVRELAVSGSRLVQSAAISVLKAMRDADAKVADHLSLVLKTTDRPMKLTAAGNLLLCQDNVEAIAFLQGIAEEDQPESEFARLYLSEWRYPIRSMSKLDTVSLQDLLNLSSESAGKVIADLRDSGHIEIELVATDRNQVIGHIAFARLTLEATAPIEATLMLPLFVHPDLRRQQIGSRLVFEGLRRCEMLGKQAVFAYGQAAFLSDFAFDCETAIVPQPLCPEWMSMELMIDALKGVEGTAILPQSEKATNG